MHLSRAHRRRALRLALLLLALYSAAITYRSCHHPAPAALTISSPDSISLLLDSLTTDSLRHHPRAASSAIVYSTTANPPATFDFDPNTADSLTLLQLGLTPYMVRAVYRYRARQGRYHSPADFRRVPGMTPELYDRLAPHIHIGRAFRYYDDADLYPPDSLLPSRPPSRPSHTYPRQEKFDTLVLLDLNAADTATLKRIPGIGSFRAHQIVDYRLRLGGYLSPAQLLDIDDFPPPLLDWFTADSQSVHRLPLATATERELGRHPYIGYARARAIIAFRHNHGSITSLQQLRLLPEFTDDDIRRIEPYIAY